MAADFKKGQVLSAQSLNDAINSMVARPAQVVPAQRGSLVQNRLPKVVPTDGSPVFLDKFSMALPEDSLEGWFVRDGCGLRRMNEMKTGAAVYLVQHTDEFGNVKASCLSSAPPTELMAWDPVACKGGLLARYVGKTKTECKNAAFNVGSCQNLFLRDWQNQTPARVVNWGQKQDEWPCFVHEFDLVAPQQGNSQLIRRIRSGGGLLEVAPASGECPWEALHLAPRVSLFHYDTCCTKEPPATGFTEPACNMMLGEWVPLARLNIGGTPVFLSGYWVTPWRVGLAFDPKCVRVELPKVAWKSETDPPVVGGWVHNKGQWKRVSLTPNVLHLCVPEMFPAGCSYKIFDYAVYEAPGTSPPETVWENGAFVKRSHEVLYVAQMRRLTHPTTEVGIGEWKLWNTSCLTCSWP